MKNVTLLFLAVLLLVYNVTKAQRLFTKKQIDTIVGNNVNSLMAGRPWLAVSAGLVKNGHAFLYRYGQAHNETIYEIGSITKTFSSILLAHAVLEKRVKVDDDIRQYLDGSYPNLQYKGQPVRLLHLVNLTSGLPNYIPDAKDAYKNMGPDSMAYAFVKNHRHYTKEQYLQDLHHVQLDTLPGYTPQHSNAAAQLLVYILEKVYHKPYAQLLKTYITGPLKMYHTFLVVPPQEAGLLEKGHTDKGALMPYVPGDVSVAFGLKSSMEDMTRYIQFQLAEKDPAVKLTHHSEWSDGRGFALGWNWLMGQGADGGPNIHANGTTLGFTTCISIYPQQGFALVLLANEYGENSNDSLGDVAEKIFLESHYTPEQRASDGFGFSVQINQLLNELNKNGFDKAIDIQKQKGWAFKEDELNMWAYALLQKGKKQEALEIFRLNVALYPESYNAFDSLGEIYGALDNKALAIKNYRRSLELNPANTNAVEHLKKLQ